MKNSLITTICSVTLLGAVATINAQSIIYNDLAGSPIGSDSAGTSALYDSFSTGSNPQNQLTDFQFEMNYTFAPGTGNISVDLYSDSSTAPGGLLGVIGTIAESSLTATATVYDMTLTVPISANAFTLAPNTRYWIGITADSHSSQWDYTSAIGGVGVAGEYTSINGVVNANATAQNPYLMQVTIEPVPEPSTLALSAMAGVGAMMVFRRKK